MVTNPDILTARPRHAKSYGHRRSFLPACQSQSACRGPLTRILVPDSVRPGQSRPCVHECTESQEQKQAGGVKLCPEPRKASGERQLPVSLTLKSETYVKPIPDLPPWESNSSRGVDVEDSGVSRVDGFQAEFGLLGGREALFGTGENDQSLAFGEVE
jgi:hypothetical protein